MFKADLIETVGADHYREACVLARRDAERTDYGRDHGRGGAGQDDTSLLPHELSDTLWESEQPLEEKISTFFAIYDEMPAYGLLMYVSDHYPNWPPAAKRQFWDAMRTRLAGSDRALARPIAYNLWCDWFEHGDHTAEAWEALARPDAPPALLQEVLIASGPVPWRLKTELYTQLIGDMSWHYYIFRSLLHSAFDVFGRLERDEALAWLERLSIPASTENLNELRARLRDS